MLIDNLIKKEIELIEKHSRMLKGNIYEINIKKKNPHEKKSNSYHLTYKGNNNITKTIYVKKDEVKNVKQMILNYKKAKSAFDRIVEINFKILKHKK